MQYELFISCPKGLEYLLEAELRALGVGVERTTPQGVFGHASLAEIYRICLWSRLANRVQLILFSGLTSNESLIHSLCVQFPWQTVFSITKSFAVSFHGTNAHIRNTMYGAQLVKDAIVDHFRKLTGTRPDVDKENPDLRLHAHLKDDFLTVSVDLSGASLHQRTYRLDAGEAPLKENLAAALLIRAGWPKLAEQDYFFHDPCCGSGTIVIEAAMMAAQIAPGLLRQVYGFMNWVGHDALLWNRIKQETMKAIRPITIKLLGTDIDGVSIKKARLNAERAGVSDLVHFETRAINEGATAPSKKGLVLCNPPFGERLGEIAPLVEVYQSLGKMLHTHYSGWQAAVLTSNPLLAKAIGLRAHKKYAFFNGPLPCELYLFNLDETNRLKSAQPNQVDAALDMLVNRLTKNLAHLTKWAKRNKIEAYRIYDADIPEYACAIDIYGEYVVFQEYLAPKSIPLHVAERRRIEMIQALIQVLKLDPEKLIIKHRQQQKGQSQYERVEQKNKKIEVHEDSAKFLVNLWDYLDTGLFLDHRLLRMQFGKLPPDTRFLNLFCYTATASVHAALAGAVTTNVDLSNTYLRWAQENFQLNGLSTAKHQFIGFDVKKWLAVARHEYDVIFLDPPTFSNSKRMEDTLDVQRDHVDLIDGSMRLLAEKGELYFSTNLRRFRMDATVNEKYLVKDITPSTIDMDFKRDQKIHRCYRIMKR
jgi:23S rRNA (guanine2445-N2)-methyltransferase / 23S rRNA (guanine2069-N7)-methyltransferase